MADMAETGIGDLGEVARLDRLLLKEFRWLESMRMCPFTEDQIEEQQKKVDDLNDRYEAAKAKVEKQ